MGFIIILILVALFVYTQSRKRRHDNEMRQKADYLEGEFEDITKK